MRDLEVMDKIGIENFKAFEDFMTGKTVGYDDGKINYYPDDVDKFISILSQKKRNASEDKE